MRIFLDTANVTEIKKIAKMGIVGGVTTNPSLVAKEGLGDYEAVVKEICKVITGPVSAEVLAEDTAGMIEQARQIATWAPNVNVKIPITTAGLEATATLAKEHIKVNMTLCFSVNQAMLAALAGAAFVSPFIGRLDDIGQDGMALVKDLVEIFDNYKFDTQVIAASIRHPMHCLMAAKAGAHIATIPTKVILQMVHHPLTDSGIARFLADWKSVSKQ